MAKMLYGAPGHREGKLKTAKQWLALGYKPKNKNIKGTEYCVNILFHTYATYFLDTEVKPLTAKQKIELRKKRLLAKKRKQRAAAAEAARIQKEHNNWIKQSGKRSLMAGKPIKTADYILFDTETTGLYAYDGDEIIQLSIIDLDGNVLYNDYFQPEHNYQWPGASMVNGLWPRDVIGYRLFRDALPEIQQIFSAAKSIIGYNIAGFDLFFMQNAGIKIPANARIYDVMDEATIPGEKWPKLTEAAAVIGYDWDQHGEAHDALADCYATLEVYGALIDGSYFRKLYESREAAEKAEAERIARIEAEYKKRFGDRPLYPNTKKTAESC